MGITTKIWPASAWQIRACVADPKRVDHLFHRAGAHYAMIHDSRKLQQLLRSLADAGAGLVAVPPASDAEFAMWPGAVRRLRYGRDPAEPLRALLAFPSTCVNKIEIADVARRAVFTLRGLLFSVYEDW
jgi:hypothetical protein